MCVWTASHGLVLCESFSWLDVGFYRWWGKATTSQFGCWIYPQKRIIVCCRGKRLSLLSWKKRLERHPPKIQKVKKWKVKKYTFWLFDFSTFLLASHLSAFRLFVLSSSLSTLNGLSFVLLAAHVQLKRLSAKKTESRKVKSQKVYFSKF